MVNDLEQYGLSMITGWWLSPTPLKNDGVSSSVGMMFHSQLNGKIYKIDVPVTTKQPIQWFQKTLSPPFPVATNWACRKMLCTPKPNG